MRLLNSVLIIIMVISFSGCLDPFDPPVIAADADFLVVDAQINATDQLAVVRLSKGVVLSSTEENPQVSDATVRIKDSAGNFFDLANLGSGKYQLNAIFKLDRQYRLLIRLKDGKNFISDWINLQPKQPISDLRWEADEENLKFLVSSTSAGEGPFYFRYDYEETFEYRSVFSSDWIFSSPFPVYRNAEDNISICWTTNLSSSALLTATEGLQTNIVNDFNVLRIPRGDRRLWFAYSLLIRQYAVDKKTFEYWEKLRKVSESLGGLFDPVPFSVKGNIYPDVNGDAEPDNSDGGSVSVLGYFSGGEVSSKRITVRNFELPSGYYLRPPTNCTEIYVKVGDLETIAGRDINLTRAQYEGLSIIGFYYGIPACTDCRLEGGSPLKPLFMN